MKLQIPICILAIIFGAVGVLYGDRPILRLGSAVGMSLGTAGLFLYLS